MPTSDIAAALERVELLLTKRASVGLQDDTPCSARWTGQLGVVATHPGGRSVPTDMPREFGGNGEAVSPGWLLRAALASCTATCIVMAAARASIELDLLEVDADSVSDMRGFFGMPGDGERPAPAAPLDLQLTVRIAAAGVGGDRLRALVEATRTIIPVLAAVEGATPVVLKVDAVDG
jgi:uncharacterized OsmC-like protein